LLNRNFLLLWAAYGISAIGDHLSEMALLKQRGGFERDDVTRVQALISFGFFLPFVFIGPVAGWWADRFSRKWTLIIADVLRGVLVINLSLLVPHLAQLGWGDYSIVAPIVVIGALAAFFSPCRQALLPTLIRDEQLVRANALISALGTIGTIVSAVIGGVLVDLAVRGSFGLHWNYRLDALTFALSAVLVAGIATRSSRATAHPKQPGLIAPIVTGFRYVAQHRRVLQIISVGVAFWAAAGVVVSVVPALVRDIFGGSFADAGVYRGLIGIGLASGAAVMTVVGPTMPLQLRVLLGLGGGAFWVLALWLAYVLTLGQIFAGVCLFGIGGAGAMLLVTVMAALQRFVPDSRRGRVFGVSDMATMGAMVAASGALGLPNIPRLDDFVWLFLLATGLGLAVTFWIAAHFYHRDRSISFAFQWVWWFVHFYVAFWCRAKRIGPCRVPRTGPVMLACNHASAVDPLVLECTQPHRLVGFLVAREHYAMPIAHWVMRNARCIPVNRTRPGKSFLRQSLELLRSGGCLGIFPHGTFHEPGEQAPQIKHGVGYLALRSGATIIPCHISGATFSRSPFGSLLRRHKVRVRYGDPVDVSAFANRTRDRAAAAELSDLVMRRIDELGRR